MSFSKGNLVLDALSACEQSYNTASFEGNGVEVLRLTGDRCDLLAFRGTDDAADAIKDLRAFPWPSPVGFVHSGFYKGVKSVMPQILDVMKQGTNVVFTGHSKGGAEAVIAAALCEQAGLPPSGIITFGAPRAGFSKLSRVTKDIIHLRYVNANDAVPSHPWPVWGYRHTAPEINLSRMSKGRYDDHPLSAYRKSAEFYFG